MPLVLDGAGLLEGVLGVSLELEVMTLVLGFSVGVGCMIVVSGEFEVVSGRFVISVVIKLLVVPLVLGFSGGVGCVLVVPGEFAVVSAVFGISVVKDVGDNVTPEKIKGNISLSE